MKRCLFTYDVLPARNANKNYSSAGLKKLSSKLTDLKVFPYDQSEQIAIAQKMAGKISIQGVQPKFSANLNFTEQCFESVEKYGKYILKPQVIYYSQLPENEDLSMRLIAMAGMETPWHGLIRCSDQSLSYIIKRFDRFGKSGKIAVEDFSQLLGSSRDAKYDIPLEKIIEAIEDYCSFPTLEYLKLFKLVVLSFLLGNEDLHLKNISLITTQNKSMPRIKLSPIYDFLNTSIALAEPKEELALSLLGKKSGFNQKDFVSGFAEDLLFLPKKKAENEISQILALIPEWSKLIEKSFLSEKSKKDYLKLIKQRAKKIQST